MLKLQFWKRGAVPELGAMYQTSSAALPADGLMMGGARKFAGGANPLSHCSAAPVVEGRDNPAVF
jgi:hypothetical protein